MAGAGAGASSVVPKQHLVIECTRENEALTSALLSFLEAFTAPRHMAQHKQSGAWYHGECRVIRHGEGTAHHSGAGAVVSGLWEHNVYKGPKAKASSSLYSSSSSSSTASSSLFSSSSFHHLPLSSADIRELPEDEGIVSPPLSPPRSGPSSTSHMTSASTSFATFASSASPSSSSSSTHHLAVATTSEPRSASSSSAAEGVARLSRLLPLGSTIHEFFFPDELLLYVFSFLDIQSLCTCAQVSTDWRRLTNDAVLWTDLHIRMQWGLPDEKEEGATRDWREIVKGRYLLERNWLNGHYHMSTLRGHTGWVTCVDFYANKLVSSSYDGTVRIWNTQTGNMLQTLKNESNGVLSPVWCLQFDKNRIMTGSSDSKLREFDPNTGQCTQVIGGHDGGVKCLQFTSELLVTGSDDKTIKIFDVRTGKYIKTIKVPCGGSISCLQFQDDVLCTASKREKAIYTFDLRRSNHYQRVLEAHSKAVYCLQFDLATNRLVSGARDRQIFVWDFEKGEVIKKLSGHRYTVMNLRFDNNKIVSGAADDSLRIWDMHSGECIQILQGHTEMVTSLKFDASKIVSGSADRTCIVWDFLRGRPEDRGFSFFGY